MTMPSSNPAFSRFGPDANGRQQPAPWATQAPPAPGQYGAPTQYDPYAAPSPYAATTTRYMTMDDVVTKTGITFLVTVLAAAAVWSLPGTTGWALALPAVLVGLVLGLVISFKTITNPAAILAYAAIEGVFLGAISEAFEMQFGGGIVMQAVIGTFGVFAGMLVVYKTGAIRVTPKFTRWIIGALVGVLVLMLANGIAYLFSDN